MQVRYSSKRLPGKVLMDIAGQSLIQRLHDRLLTLQPLPVYFLTSDDPSDDILIEHFKEHNISFFRGSLDNVLERFIIAGEALGFENFFRVTGDNPFVDVHTMAKNWQNFLKYDYVDNIHGEGNTIGTGFEFVSLNALKSIPKNNTDKYHLEHVTTYIREHSKDYKHLRFLPVPELRKKGVFLTCDYKEDFDLLENIYQNFRFSNYISAEMILKFLENNPEFLAYNRHLHNTPNY